MLPLDSRFSRHSVTLTLTQRNAAPASVAFQTRSYAEAKASPTEVSSILEQRIRGVQEESNLAETGRVLSVGYVSPFRRIFLATDMKRKTYQKKHTKAPPSAPTTIIN